MRRVLYLLPLFFLLLFFYSCRNSSSQTIATIRPNQFINSADFRSRYLEFLEASGVKDSRAARLQILNNIITEILLLDVRNNDLLLNQPEVKQSLEQIENELILAWYKSREVLSAIEISEAELKSAFAKMNVQLAARHLFTRDEAEAWRLYAALNNGATFEQLAPLVFQDDSLSRSGGWLGYFTWGDMDPDFEAAAFELQPGEISKPVRTAHGFSIIRVDDRILNPILTEYAFLQKKGTIERLLRLQKQKQAGRRFLETRLEALHVQIDDESLAFLRDQLQAGPDMIVSADLETDLRWEQILIRLRKKTFTVAEVYKLLNGLPRSARVKIKSKELLAASLKGLMLQDLLLSEAREKGYDREPQVTEKYLKWSRLKLLGFLEEQVAAGKEIPDSLIADYYQAHRDELKSEAMVTVQEILLKDKAEAERIRLLLKDGADFSDLARQHSLRKSPDGLNGILPHSPVSRFGPLAGELAAAPLNRICGPVEAAGYFVIYRVLRRDQAVALEFDQVRPGIETVLRTEYKRAFFQEHIDSLRRLHPVWVDTTMLMGLKLRES